MRAPLRTAAGSGARLDHVVIVVADLATARDDFQSLGFRVVPGGRHRGTPTHNALVVFADGTYLELFAPRDDESRQASRDPWLARLDRGEGMIAYALACGSLPAAPRDAADLRWDTEEDGRETPDCEKLRWRVLLPVADDAISPLPFFIQDLTPREARVPLGTAHGHSLPVLGIARLRVACHDPEHTAGQIGELLGSSPSEGEGRILRFVLEGEPTQVIEVVGRESDAGAADHLDRLGEGPFELTFSHDPCAGDGEIQLLDGASHGIDLRASFR